MRTPTAGILSFFAAAMLVAPISKAQDDLLRIRQLETEVLRLQREIDAQSSRIDSLERGGRTAGVSRPLPTTPRPADNSPAWLVSTNWDRLKPGMKDLDVIALLGRPTSVRTDDNAKSHVLLYALELGPNAVLAGNVHMTEAGVGEINRPVLR